MTMALDPALRTGLWLLHSLAVPGHASLGHLDGLELDEGLARGSVAEVFANVDPDGLEPFEELEDVGLLDGERQPAELRTGHWITRVNDLAWM